MGGLIKSFAKKLGLISDGGGVPLAMPAPPAPPPSREDAGASVDDAAAKVQEEEDRLRRRKGRAATVLTGDQGAGLPNTAAKTLTGG